MSIPHLVLAKANSTRDCIGLILPHLTLNSKAEIGVVLIRLRSSVGMFGQRSFDLVHLGAILSLAAELA